MKLINSAQGSYNLYIRKEGILELIPLCKTHQDSFVPSSYKPCSRELTFSRQLGPRFYTTSLGLVGGIGFVVSCIWSILIPAIASTGVMAFAYLLDRKITLLPTKELSLEATKSQRIFEQQIGRGADFESLLDTPINTSNLPLPLPPTSSLCSTINNPNILSPPPPPPPPMPSIINNPNILSPPLPPPMSSIINNPNILSPPSSLKEELAKYPSSLLVKELKTCYEKGLAKGELELLGATYFKDKINKFKDNFGKLEQKGNQTAKEDELKLFVKKYFEKGNQSTKNTYQEIRHLPFYIKNMELIKCLLLVLSEREDFSDRRKYCSEKLKTVDKHIQDLICFRDRKRNKESTFGIGSLKSDKDKKLNKEKEFDKFNFQLELKERLAGRRLAQACSDSEPESNPQSDWEGD